MVNVTIGVVARERFSVARRCIQSIYDHTSIPFRLVVVDANTPPRYRRELEEVLAGRPDVELISRDEYLLTNAAKNLIIERTDTEYLALVENDNLVADGWLEHLVAAAEETPADVATPVLFEGRRWPGKAHFDCRIADVRNTMDGQGNVAYEFVDEPQKLQRDLVEGRKLVRGIETHCLLFRREVFDRIGPFDETIRTRKEVDLILALHHHGVRIVLEPRSRVLYIPPPPVRRDERPFYRMTWDLDGARRSHERIQEKWRVSVPRTIGFARTRHQDITYLGKLRRLVRHQLRMLVKPPR